MTPKKVTYPKYHYNVIQSLCKCTVPRVHENSVFRIRITIIWPDQNPDPLKETWIRVAKKIVINKKINKIIRI